MPNLTIYISQERWADLQYIRWETDASPSALVQKAIEREARRIRRQREREREQRQLQEATT